MEAWASDAVRQVGTFVEPAWTWNVIVTVAVGIMVWSLKRNIVKADELKEKIIANAIASLEKSITDWQAGAKERTASLCKKIDQLAKEKMDVHECDRIHKNVDQTIDDLKKKVYV